MSLYNKKVNATKIYLVHIIYGIIFIFTDPEQNSCDAKEAEYDPMTELEDFIHIKYAEGSLVWARMAGYPW